MSVYEFVSQYMRPDDEFVLAIYGKDDFVPERRTVSEYITSYCVTWDLTVLQVRGFDVDGTLYLLVGDRYYYDLE